MTSASSLSVYERVIAHYPHLSSIKDAKIFCRQLCALAAVPTITPLEYVEVAAIAEGEKRQTPQDRYAAKSIRRYALNINRNTDADILVHLEQLDNVQGYIKDLIRDDLKRRVSK